MGAFDRLSRAAGLGLSLGLVAAASPALAQSGPRYLTWPGKPAGTSHPSATAPVVVPEASAGSIMSLPVRPMVPPVATRYSGRTSPGPTPADAWIAPRRETVSAAYAPAPALVAPAVSMPAASGSIAASAPHSDPSLGRYPGVRPAPRAMPVQPAYTPPAPVAPARIERPAEPAWTAPAPMTEADMSEAAPPPRAPVAADTGPEATPPSPPSSPVSPTAPVAEAAPEADPYAPRRDAPIFRLLTRNAVPVPAVAPEAPPAPTDEADDEPAEGDTPPARTRSGDDGLPADFAVRIEGQAAPQDADRTPRRYSVHRANGQAPDRVLTGPVSLEAGADLAAPPETPQVVRGTDGRLIPLTPPSDPGVD